MKPKKLKPRRTADSTCTLSVTPLKSERSISLFVSPYTAWRDSHVAELTPSEARRLAKYLIEAADAVAPRKATPLASCTCDDGAGAYSAIEMFGHARGCPRAKS